MGSSVILPPTGQPREGPDPSFQSATQPNFVTFQLKNVSPPSPLYLQRDDVLRLNVWNSIAGQSININGRLLLPPQLNPGQPDVLAKLGVPPELIGPAVVVPFSVTFTPTSNRVRSGFNVQFLECYLLSLQLFATQGTGTPLRGQVFCEVEVLRGTTATPLGMWTLICDYLTNGASLSWPGGRIVQSVEGPGFLHSQAVTTPGAGAEWTITVPANTRWRLICGSATLNTSATVANRAPTLQLTDGANVYFIGPPNQVVAAGTTVRLSYAQTQMTAAANVADLIVLAPPGIWMPAGHVISSLTRNIQVGDQYAVIELLLEEWIET